MEVEENKWQDIDNMVLRPSPFRPEDQLGGSEQQWRDNLQSPILVIGAGGLGCEILKNLALSGFTDIHVVDMDTIDLTNLNRQFLFRNKDIGKGKAETAANFIMKRVKGVTVTPYNNSIQELLEINGQEFYKQFKIVIAGLDNVQARQWLNAQLHRQTDFTADGEVDPNSFHYMVDGGTEGLTGQARVIRPFISNCYECTLAQMPKDQAVNMCTIASVPRSPAHCVMWVMQLSDEGTWAHAHPDRKWDTDSYEDMNELFQLALARANKYNIQGVTYESTCGTVKNIIPAVASTNALISAACVNEAFKIATRSSDVLDNRYLSIGQDTMYGNTAQEQKQECSVCQKPKMLTFSQEKTVGDLQQYLKQTYSIQDPSIKSDYGDLVGGIDASIDTPMLVKVFKDMLETEEWYDCTIISVYDPLSKFDQKFLLTFE